MASPTTVAGLKSFACLSHLTEHDPQRAWKTLLHLLATLKTVDDAGALAAGALEDFIATHGETMIEQVEAMARRSPRFRFVLTGVWPQLRSHEDYWKRVEKARADSPTLDESNHLPDV